MNTIHVGDWGFPLRFAITDGNTGGPFDLTDVTSLLVFLKRPGKKPVISREAEVDGDPLNGRAHIDVILDDIDIDGQWEVQLIISSPIQRRALDPVKFTVLPNLAPLT